VEKRGERGYRLSLTKSQKRSKMRLVRTSPPYAARGGFAFLSDTTDSIITNSDR
jgi:hypothetical protein